MAIGLGILAPNSSGSCFVQGLRQPFAATLEALDLKNRAAHLGCKPSSQRFCSSFVPGTGVGVFGVSIGCAACF